MTWQKYEAEVASELERCYPGSNVQRDVKTAGVLSGASRQIDLVLEMADQDPAVVEIKRYGRKMHVKDVEAFIGMLHDVGAKRGLLICPKGYSKAAIQRAWRGTENLELDVLSLEDLRSFQGFGGIPYAGSNGALLSAPFGWVLDLDTGPVDALAVLYRRGRTLETAMRAGERMYVQCWQKDEVAATIPELLAHQRAYMVDAIEGLTIETLPPPPHPASQTALRVSRYPDDVTVELTGFVEFEGAIFFLVLLTTPEDLDKNIRKMSAAVSGLRSIRLVHSPDRSGNSSQEAV